MIFKLQRLFLLFLLLPAVAFSQIPSTALDTSPSKEVASTPNSSDLTDSSNDPLKAELISEHTSILPGRSFWVAIALKLDKGWHTYWKNPGEVGMPTELEWHLPAGYSVADVQWPYPHKYEEEGIVTFGYEGKIYLLAQIVPPVEIKEADAQIDATVNWMACKDSCVPGSSTLSLKLPVKEGSVHADANSIFAFAEARNQIPQHTDEVRLCEHCAGSALLLPKLQANEKYVDAYFFSETPLGETTPFHQELAGKKGHEKLIVSADQLLTHRGVLVVKTEHNGKESVSAWQVDMEEQPVLPAGVDSMNFGLALLMAFVGGLILNLMPCVLPVIALKVMSFVKLSGESRAATIKHGLAFFGGAMIAFWALAAIILAFRAYGESVGWGFQLQSPLFVAALALVLLIFGLSLFGVFEMGTSLSSLAGNAQYRKTGLIGSFSSGVLATAVATPCTGPFLGTTVGFAMTLSNLDAMLVFSAMGVGMGFPYLLLSFFPKLLRFLPKPGAWMVTFKELMGFLMMATVLWLSWIFASQTSSTALMLLFAGFFSVALGCWTYGKWGSPVKSFPKRLTSWIIAFVFVGAGSWAAYTASGFEEEPFIPNSATVQGQLKDEWIPFSSEKLADLRQKGVPVFIDFTAKWCLICQANKIVLHSSDVVKKFSEHGVVKMRADWTKSDKAITEELKKHGRNGVPLYLFYGPDPKVPAEVLPQVLTSDVMISTLDSVAPSQDKSNIADVPGLIERKK